MIRGRLRRFAAVGVVVTAVDVAVLLLLRLRVDLPVIVADAIAIAVAAAVSYVLNRWLTFADDPHSRWVHEPFTFVVVTAVAGALDISVIRAVVAIIGSDDAASLLPAKAIALGAAGVVRALGYRRIVFRSVRGQQGRKADRGPAPGSHRLSVVVPAYCEAGRIRATVEQLREDLVTVAPVEIVVVDDGSVDGTGEEAESAGADKVVRQPENRGKGAAVRAGALAADGRTVAFVDADLAYPPAQILRLLGEVEAGWDVVVGSRRHIDTTTLVRARRLRIVTGRLFNLLTTAVLLGHYRDTQCGLKAFRSDVARLLFRHTRIDGFAFDVEVFHLAERYRLSLTEVPVSLSNTDVSTVRVGPESVRMVRDLFRIRRWAGRGLYDLEPGEWRPIPRQ